MLVKWKTIDLINKLIFNFLKNYNIDKLLANLIFKKVENTNIQNNKYGGIILTQ